MPGTGRRLSGIDVAREGDVRLEGQKLEESLEKAENILGVIIQSDLKWTKQVQSLRTKLKHRLAGLAITVSAVPLRGTTEKKPCCSL